MLQRIQTVYLSLALLAQIALFFPGLFSIHCGEDVFLFGLTGLKKVTPDGHLLLNQINAWFPMILNIAICALIFFVITRYKNRKLQQTLAALGILMLCGLLALILFSFDKVAVFIKILPCSSTGNVSSIYGVALVIPGVSMVLLWLAIRGIRKDIALLRSADRLR